MTARLIERYGLTARIAGLLAWLAFFMPWCGQFRGVDLMQGDPWHRMAAVPLMATLLLVLPGITRRGLRLGGEALAALVLVAAAGWVMLRVGRLRGPGASWTLVAGLIALAGVALQAARRPPATSPADSPDR